MHWQSAWGSPGSGKQGRISELSFSNSRQATYCKWMVADVYAQDLGGHCWLHTDFTHPYILTTIPCGCRYFWLGCNHFPPCNLSVSKGVLFFYAVETGFYMQSIHFLLFHEVRHPLSSNIVHPLLHRYAFIHCDISPQRHAHGRHWLERGLAVGSTQLDKVHHRLAREYI